MPLLLVLHLRVFFVVGCIISVLHFKSVILACNALQQNQCCNDTVTREPQRANKVISRLTQMLRSVRVRVRARVRARARYYFEFKSGNGRAEECFCCLD